MLELSLTLAPAEGALVRVLGLIERRGFRLGAVRSEPSPRGLDVFLQLPADRPGDVLLRQVQRLHGPIGLPIGSRTPAEIALSLMAEVVALKNGALAPSLSAQQRCA